MKTPVVKAACAALLLFILLPGLGAPAARAAPADPGVAARFSVRAEKARVVCGPYRCWREPGWGYGPRRGHGAGWGWRRRHHWHGYGWRPHPYW